MLRGLAGPKKTKIFLLLTPLVVGCLFVSVFPRQANAATVFDNFNRADGGLGSDWTTISGTTAPQISGNQMVPGTPGVLNAAFWSADSFSSDQYAQGTFTAPFVSGQYGPGIAVRLANSRGYFLWYGNADNTVSIWRMDSPTSMTQLAGSSTLTMATSDVWKLEVVGATLTGYQNGVQVVQAVDGTYAGGNPGVWLYNANNDIDDWSAGDIPSTYSINGTISGLDGTVTLQNNGANDITVSNNGRFIFNKPLASGSAYDVTVASSPSGQSCAVANGSGTVSSADVTTISVTCTGSPPSASGGDDFNRSDGPLGSDWSDFADGGLTISGQTVKGAGAAAVSGDTRTSETYTSDQYSQIEITSAPFSGNDWIGPAVRSQNGGQDLYAGLYVWNNGAPYLQMFKRTSGSWATIGGSYNCGVLSAGTKLKLEAVGSALALLENGTERLAVYDSTSPLTGGEPGIVAYGSSPTADNWSAGNAGFQVNYLSTDANGVETYDMLSPMNGYGPQKLRILRPTNPTPGTKHSFIYALPVEAGLGTTYGDGMDTLRTLDAQNQYNLTIIAPSFGVEPWYADNPNDPQARQESFMTSELVPWVKANLATTGYEQNWLIGFSKSGIGATDLFLKHPDLFTLVAAWDFPAEINSYSEFGASSENSYGTDANLQDNYRLTNDFMQAHKAPFLSENRIWLGGYNAFQTDVTQYDAILTGLGIQHTMETPTLMTHAWDSGWVPLALAALHQGSVDLPDTTAPTITGFTTAPTTNTLTVPITSLTATDDTAVTGYKVTESSAAPAASSSGWASTPPASYTFSSYGSKTLYAWAKDAAGNISASATSTVNITPIYTLGGTASGLAGTVTLEDADNGTSLIISKSGSFTFNGKLAGGQSYKVSILDQPSSQTCTISHGVGAMTTASVDTIQISCTTRQAAVTSAPRPTGTPETSTHAKPAKNNSSSSTPESPEGVPADNPSAKRHHVVTATTPSPGKHSVTQTLVKSSAGVLAAVAIAGLAVRAVRAKR